MAAHGTTCNQRRSSYADTQNVSKTLGLLSDTELPCYRGRIHSDVRHGWLRRTGSQRCSFGVSREFDSSYTVGSFALSSSLWSRNPQKLQTSLSRWERLNFVAPPHWRPCSLLLFLQAVLNLSNFQHPEAEEHIRAGIQQPNFLFHYSVNSQLLIDGHRGDRR